MLNHTHGIPAVDVLSICSAASTSICKWPPVVSDRVTVEGVDSTPFAIPADGPDGPTA